MYLYREPMVNWPYLGGWLTLRERNMIDTVLDPLHDLDRWAHPWPGPWIFKVEFRNSYMSGTGCQIGMNERDIKGCDVGTAIWLLALTPPMTLTLVFLGQILKEFYFGNGFIINFAEIDKKSIVKAVFHQAGLGVEGILDYWLSILLLHAFSCAFEYTHKWH